MRMNLAFENGYFFILVNIMDFFDHIINRFAVQDENPGRLSSYRQAAELICMCWNQLDVSIIEPYLDDNVTWKGGQPNREIHGKEKYLKLMEQIFNSLQYSKNSYKADIVGREDYYFARITIDGEYQDFVHHLKIEDGLIKEIWIIPSGEWLLKQNGGSPFGVFLRT